MTDEHQATDDRAGAEKPPANAAVSGLGAAGGGDRRG